MEDVHLSLETLARWLAGELEHEQVLREVAPHLIASCSNCQRLHDKILALQEESGHWSEVVAVVETREAPALAESLDALPFEEQMRRIDEDESLHTWGLCQHLIRSSQECLRQEPARAVERAQLAVRLSELLGEAYHPEWVEELRARAQTQLEKARTGPNEPKGTRPTLVCKD